MILLLGARTDGWIEAVSKALEGIGRDVVLLSEGEMRTGFRLRLDFPRSPAASYLSIGDRCVALKDLLGVFVRWSRQSIRVGPFAGDDSGYFASEYSALAYGMLDTLGCPVVNRLRPPGWPAQPGSTAIAEALQACDFSVPVSLRTSSAAEAVEFFARRRNSVLASVSLDESPILIGGVGGFDDLLHKRAAAYLLQDAPPGQWMRLLVVGDVVAAKPWVGTAGAVMASGPLSDRCIRLASVLELHMMELLLLRRPGNQTVIYRIDDLPNPDWCETALRFDLAAAVVSAFDAGVSART